MATVRIGQRRNARLYIEQWLEHSGLSDETVANRIGVSRQTVFRWRTGKRRPDILALAAALDIEPERFYRPPEQHPSVSLDEIAKDYSTELRDMAVRLVKSLKQTGT